jgi:hypothetical protein
MPTVGDELLGRVKPLVDGEIIFHAPAPPTDAGGCVKERVHDAHLLLVPRCHFPPRGGGVALDLSRG